MRSATWRARSGADRVPPLSGGGPINGDGPHRCRSRAAFSARPVRADHARSVRAVGAVGRSRAFPASQCRGQGWSPSSSRSQRPSASPSPSFDPVARVPEQRPKPRASQAEAPFRASRAAELLEHDEVRAQREHKFCSGVLGLGCLLWQCSAGRSLDVGLVFDCDVNWDSTFEVDVDSPGTHAISRPHSPREPTARVLRGRVARRWSGDRAAIERRWSGDGARRNAYAHS